MACDFPFYVQNPGAKVPGVPYEDRVPVPCGRCPSCLARRVAIWSARLQIHARDFAEQHFVTLDYAHPALDDKGRMTLVKKHLQHFFKRLRKSMKGARLAYYAVGEYGTLRWRPHYHAIIFGATAEQIQHAWESYDDPTNTYVTGRVHLGKVAGASIAYTLKYMNKGKRVPQYHGDNRLPEFAIMSKHIGDRFLSSGAEHTRRNSIPYMVREGGVKVPLPRHWREKIFTRSQRDRITVQIREQANDDEAKRQEEYKVRTGSMDGYHQSQTDKKHEMIRKVTNDASRRGG